MKKSGTKKRGTKKRVMKKPVMNKLVDKVETEWNEEWKKITTKRPTNKVDYYISDYGRIKSVVKEDRKERLLKPAKMPKGYMTINMTVEGPKREVYHIHRLVHALFMKKQEGNEKFFVVHKDGNKENNHVRNLEILDREQLTKRWDEKGFYKEASTTGKHVKLTENKVRMLKKMLKSGKTKKRILARKFNISLTQVKRIEIGENWAHVEI
jgi:hypothetical protein